MLNDVDVPPARTGDAWVNHGWGENGDYRDDFGFVALDPDAHGHQVGNVVGEYGMEANQGYVNPRTVWGY
ncbi:hypothetical protein ABH941_003266 [Streptacidiphilus sp. EB103A]